MEALINNLFSQSQSEAIIKLWKDADSRSLIEKEIGKQILNSQKILATLPFTQLMFITSMASFATSLEETSDVASIIFWGINKKDILPLVSEHVGKELAYRCLVSLGFFKQAIIMRTERRAAPPLEFYRSAGIKAFKSIGEVDISNHFCLWENYISEMFV